MSKGAEQGIVLLEVIVAFVVFALVGSSMAFVVAEGVRTHRYALSREEELAKEVRVMTAMTLLSRKDLDLRLGRRAIGEFAVSVARPDHDLYRISIARTDELEGEDLVTVVYRSESRDAR